MIVLIKLILITSVWVLGLTIATQEDMVFGNLRRWAEGQDKKIYETIILCEWCMPTVHSLFGYCFAIATGIVSDLNWGTIIMYPLVVMGSSIVCGITWSIYNMIDSISQYFKTLNNGFKAEQDEELN